MKAALQDLLLSLPLHEFTFITPLPKEKIYYNKISSIIIDEWYEEPTLLIIQTVEEYEKLNAKEIATKLIQDPNLRGIVLCLPNKMTIVDEVITFFHQCALPVIEVENSKYLSLFNQNSNIPDPNSQLSIDLIGFANKGFINISTELSHGLQTPILFLDENNQLLWQTGQDEHLKIANQWLLLFRKLDFKRNPHRDSLEDSDLFEIYPINITKDINLSLVVFKNIGDWQRKIINKFIGFTALVLQTEQIFQEEKERFKEHFVYQLLYQKFESKKSMVMQGKAWGWNLERSQHLIVIDFEQSNSVLLDSDGIDGITDFIESNKDQIYESLIVFPFQGQVIALIEGDEEEQTNKERKDFVLEITKRLEMFLKSRYQNVQFSIGIGKWYKDSIHLNKSYQEAKIALQFGRVWYKNENIFHIYDLGLFHLLLNLNQGILRDYVQEYLSLLIKHDTEQGTEYMKTIEAYIEHQGVVNEVSEILFVHPNTIRKRLKRIEEITGINLQDFKEFMNLAVAVKIHSFIKS